MYGMGALGGDSDILKESPRTGSGSSAAYPFFAVSTSIRCEWTRSSSHLDSIPVSGAMGWRPGVRRMVQETARFSKLLILKR
jgi:hypothetical protein